MALLTAWLVLTRAGGLTDAPTLALVFLDLHAHGYDLGLVFFGVNSLIMGLLVWRSGRFAKAFGAGLAVAGLVYLIGSGLRFFAPDLSSAFLPAYGLTILTETAFCLRLLLQTGPRRGEPHPHFSSSPKARRDPMSERGFTVRALGEIAIRCVDHGAMVAFYRDVIGLEPMRDAQDAPIVFFRIADGFEGHTAVLALFRHDIAARAVPGPATGHPRPGRARLCTTSR